LYFPSSSGVLDGIGKPMHVAQTVASPGYSSPITQAESTAVELTLDVVLCHTVPGGLNPDNVAEAVSITRPTLVDVSSGVCDASGLDKDPAKVSVNYWRIVGVCACPLDVQAALAVKY
jgi:hypothetical protein